MRILYHHRTRSTDAQRIHILELVDALKALGHEVEMVSLVPTDAKLDKPERDAGEAAWKRVARRIPYAYELLQLGYNPIGFALIMSRLLRRRVDFVYERYSLFTFAGVLAARLAGKPIILEVNAPSALEQSRDRDIRLGRFGAWMERQICRAATRVIVVSGPLRRIMESSGVPAEKIEVMPNGVRLDHFQPGAASEEKRRELGLDGRVVAGFVGWFRNWHRLDLVIEAVAQLNQKGARLALMLIGDGPAMPELKRLCAERRLDDAVIFTGPLPHAQVPAYLDLIDIAVQPAANEYCCPMKILEYMALQKAIVAPRQENITELLRENEEARFFTPGNVESLARAIGALAADREARLRTGRNAYAAVLERGYLWANNARRVAAMAQEAASGSRGRGAVQAVTAPNSAASELREESCRRQ